MDVCSHGYFFSLGKYLGPEWLSRKWCLLSSWRTSHTVFQMIFYPLEFLLRLAQQKGTRAWYCEPRQIPVAGEAMGPRKERTVASDNNFQQRSKSFPSGPQRSVALTLHPQSFFSQKTRPLRKPQLAKMQRPSDCGVPRPS